MTARPATRFSPTEQPSPSQRGAAPVGSIVGGLPDRLRRLGFRSGVTDADGTATDSQEFAATARRAAKGLARRGMRPDDVVGVLAPVGTERLTACYATMGAGGRALPLELASDLETLIDVLAATDARIILATAPLALIALELAERSRVRQVISFGTVPETTPFDELLQRADDGYDPSHGLFSNGIVSYRSAADGVHTTLHGHIELLDRFRRFDADLALTPSDTVLLEPGAPESVRAVLAAVALWNGSSLVSTDGVEEAAVREVAAEVGATVRCDATPMRVSPDP